MGDDVDPQQHAKKKKRRLNEQDKDQEVEGKDSNDKSKFDHVFSGLSVWLEFEANRDLDDQMIHLQKSCGGEECGVYPFVNHVTILYNIDTKQAGEESAEEKFKECWQNLKAQNIVLKEQSLEQTKKTKDCF